MSWFTRRSPDATVNIGTENVWAALGEPPPDSAFMRPVVSGAPRSGGRAAWGGAPSK
jgi:hypothetical protein